jgi:hypothetical protein
MEREGLRPSVVSSDEHDGTAVIGWLITLR